jgi:hypothetical protein
MQARVHSQQWGQQRVMHWPARARKERAKARAGSRQHVRACVKEMQC